MVLIQKWPFFLLFFLGNIGREIVFYDILEHKNAFLGYKNKKFKKSKKWHFSKGVNPLFWSKNGHFCQLFFLGNIGHEIVFYDILERTCAFVGYKNNNFKKWKNWHFSQAVNPWFWSKNANFPTFFFGNINQEHPFYIILERKVHFEAIKTRNSKSRKIGFGPKMAIFAYFFF